MTNSTENHTNNSLSDKELSQYWYCPHDRNMLQIHHSRRVQSPYFDIAKDHIELGINNAIASTRIPPEAKEQTRELVELFFNQNPSLDCVDLVAVICPACNAGFSAPKVRKLEGVAKDQARAIFEEHRAMKTISLGPIRIVDHYGVGRYLQDVSSGRSGNRRMWYFMLFAGLRAIILVIFLYYILGLELKIGKRWIRIGPIVLIVLIFGVVIFAVNFGFLDIIRDLFGGYYY
jgi:hypothetical protein